MLWLGAPHLTNGNATVTTKYFKVEENREEKEYPTVTTSVWRRTLRAKYLWSRRLPSLQHSEYSLRITSSLLLYVRVEWHRGYLKHDVRTQDKDAPYTSP